MLLLISNRRSTMPKKTMAGNRARCIDWGRTRRDTVRSLVSISGVVVVLQRLEREQAGLFGILVALVGRHPSPKRKLQISGESEQESGLNRNARAPQSSQGQRLVGARHFANVTRRVFAIVAGTSCISLPPRRKSRFFRSHARGVRVQAWQTHRSGYFGCVQISFGR